MDSKNKDYDFVPSEVPNQRLNEPIFAGAAALDAAAAARVGPQVERKKKGKFFSKRSFCICFSNIEIGSKLQNKDKQNYTKNAKFKARDGFFFSNVEIETEGDKEDVLLALEKMKRSKSCFMICFSNIEVGK